LLLTVMYRFFRLTANIEAQQLPPWPTELIQLGLSRQWQMPFFGGMVEAALFTRDEEVPTCSEVA
jgi:hypothetical protein